MGEPFLNDESILDRALFLGKGDLIPNWTHGYRCGGVWVRDEYEAELAKLRDERDELKAKLEIAVDALETIQNMKLMTIKLYSRTHENPYGEMIEDNTAGIAIAKIRGEGEK